MLCPCVATIPHEAAQSEIFRPQIFVRFAHSPFRITISGLLRSPIFPPRFLLPNLLLRLYLFIGDEQWIFACIIDGTILFFRVRYTGSIWIGNLLIIWININFGHDNVSRLRSIYVCNGRFVSVKISFRFLKYIGRYL